MVQSYNTSNQAKTTPTAGYARNLPKGAPPVPAFLPAKTPAASTAVTPSKLPPRAGGELTRRVADDQDYSRAYAQARAQKEGPPAYQAPGAGTGVRPTGQSPAATPGTVLGPVGRGAPMGTPPAQLEAPRQQDELRQLAMARAQRPTYEQMADLPPLPGSEFKPLYSQMPGAGEPPAEEGETTEEAEVIEEEEGAYPGGLTEEQWKAKMSAAEQRIIEEFGDYNHAFFMESKKLHGAADKYLEQGIGALSDEEIAILHEYGLMDPLESGQHKAAQGITTLSNEEFHALRMADQIKTPEGQKWVQDSESGNWTMVDMSEDELLDLELDKVAADMADDTKFKNSLDAYAQHAERLLAEQQFMAGGQLTGAGIWQTGLGARRLMQIESAHLAEVSATMSNMILNHQQAKWQAKLQWLSSKTNLWAQRKTLEMQATISAFNAAMQGADTFMEWLNANGMGDYMGKYWDMVNACQESADVQSMHCVFSAFEKFRVDHEGKLAWGLKGKNELIDLQNYNKVKNEKLCGSGWWPGNWGCTWEHGWDDGWWFADDSKPTESPANPETGKKYYTEKYDYD